MFRVMILCLPLLLGGCLGTIATVGASIIGPPLLDSLTDTTESAKALVIERNERRSSVRHARYRAEDRMCDTINEQIAKTDDFAKRVALSEMLVDCETRNYPGLFEGDVFTGLREDDPRPQVEIDNRRLSERARELD